MKESIPGYTVDTLDLGWDYAPSAYDWEHARRVAETMRNEIEAARGPDNSSRYPHGIDVEMVDKILFQGRMEWQKDIRRGRQVSIEGIGTFQAKDGVLTTATNRDVVFMPEPLLIEPWPVQMERVA